MTAPRRSAHPERTRAAATLAISAAVAFAAAGCGARNTIQGKPRHDPLPTYQAIARSYNARVAGVERLWARSVVRFWYPDAEGEEQVEQVEGNFQFARPDRVFLSFKKLGETYAVLGSNADMLWWIELGDERVAWVGDQASGARRSSEEAGIPVHPAHLIELLGVLPLPEEAPGADVSWSADGAAIEVALAPDQAHASMGVRYRLDPGTLRPARIELVDDGGRAVVAAELAKFEPVARPAGERAGPIATLIEASLDGGRRRMKLWLYDPESTPTRPRDAAFDLDAVLRQYRVERVEPMDPPTTGGSSSTIGR